MHVGDGVDVKYHDMGGSKHAESIRIVNPAVKQTLSDVEKKDPKPEVEAAK